jgi:Cupin
VPRDPREALYHRLEKAPLEHVEALLAAYEVLQGLHDRGVLETLRGVRCIGIQTADEWQLYLSGRARVTIFGAHGRTKTETFGPGEVAFIKQGFGHCVEQIGDEPTKVLILLKSPVYEEINISTWLAANPAIFITDNFGVGKELVDKLPTQSVGIAAAQAG